MSATLDVRRSQERFTTDRPGLTSRHSFSFGAHYDPGNTGFGLLVAHNAETIAPGSGFAPHPHRDLEILTWVLTGALQHTDDQGGSALVTPGTVQRVSAGRGVVHAETNASVDQPVHLVQLWVLPDRRGEAPGYDQRDVSAELAGGGLVRLAAGPGRRAALGWRQQHAALSVARLVAGERLRLPAVSRVHLYVAVGVVDLDGAGRLTAGDAVRLSGADGPWLTSQDVAEVLVYEMTR